VSNLTSSTTASKAGTQPAKTSAKLPKKKEEKLPEDVALLLKEWNSFSKELDVKRARAKKAQRKGVTTQKAPASTDSRTTSAVETVPDEPSPSVASPSEPAKLRKWASRRVEGSESESPRVDYKTMVAQKAAERQASGNGGTAEEVDDMNEVRVKPDA